MSIEFIRRSYRPVRIRLLLVGESPPASGDFFYTGGNMTAFTETAFSRATGRDYSSPEEFLKAFKRSGCYLEDLCRKPINKQSRSERKRAHGASIIPLAARLRQLNPDAVVIVMRAIALPVKTAVTTAGLSCPVYVLPFPGNGHQNTYIKQLVPLIKQRSRKTRSI